MSKLVFCGDFFYDYDYITDDIKKISEYVKKNNLKLIVNLEAPLVASDQKTKKRGPNLVQGEQAIEVLKLLNVFGVCLANNHIMDYGTDALEQTIKLLDENEILHCGAGSDLSTARVPMELELDGEHIAILNYGWDIEEVIIAKEDTPGAAPREKEMILEDIKKCKLDGKKPIINMHWGYEYNLLPQPYDIYLAHDMIDAGALLVIGHHSHVIQAKEVYHEREIYYSLGNFYFGARRPDYKKQFKTEYIYDCNYGAMIMLNSGTWKTNIDIIQYHKEEDYSELASESAYPLRDITNENLGYAYIKKVKELKNHVNPVLTDKTSLNMIKTWYLQFIVRKVLRAGWLLKKRLLGK